VELIIVFIWNINLNDTISLLSEVSANGRDVRVSKLVWERLLDEKCSFFTCPFQTLSDIPGKMPQV